MICWLLGFNLDFRLTTIDLSVHLCKVWMTFGGQVKVPRSVLLMIFSEHFGKQVGLIIMHMSLVSCRTPQITDGTSLWCSDIVLVVIHQAQDIW